MEKPYVGVTGASNVKEVEEIVTEFDEVGYDLNSSHVAMLGILVNYKTLNRRETKNRRYPKIDDLEAMLTACNGKVMPMIHYHTKEQGTLNEQIHSIYERIYYDKLCNTLQLNIKWPNIKQVVKIKKDFPEMKIVFQLNEGAMKGFFKRDRSAKRIAKLIGTYGKSIDYVLIDPSGGKGKNFNFDRSFEIFNELRGRLPSLLVGFSGGLSKENVRGRLQDLIARTSTQNFSIDAEGGLRDKLSDSYGDDLLNLEKVSGYLSEAATVLP